MIESLLNQTAAPTLARSASFTTTRHALLAENIVNASTPGYRQKDLDVQGFRSELRDRINKKDRLGNVNADVPFEQTQPDRTLTFHDGNNRSMEELMAQSTENAMRHNLTLELLRKQFGLMQLAIRERVA